MIYTCEIITKDIPSSKMKKGVSDFSHKFLAKIINIKYGDRKLPAEFETVIVFKLEVCKEYDEKKNQISFPHIWIAPLEMICVNDYVEFEGTPYKNGKPSNPSYPEDADWTTIDTTSHIRRLPHDLKSARKLVQHFERIKREETSLKRKAILNWPHRKIKNGIRWCKSQSTQLTIGVISGLIILVIWYLLTTYIIN